MVEGIKSCVNCRYLDETRIYVRQTITVGEGRKVWYKYGCRKHGNVPDEVEFYHRLRDVVCPDWKTKNRLTPGSCFYSVVDDVRHNFLYCGKIGSGRLLFDMTDYVYSVVSEDWVKGRKIDIHSSYPYLAAKREGRFIGFEEGF